MKIAVCLPTRGIVLTQVLQSIERERKTYDMEIFYKEGLGIPEGHNEAVKEALLRTDANYILMVEEDNVIPNGGIKAMLNLMRHTNAGIVCIDYGVNGYSCTAKERRTKEILWCGLGCTLVRRSVFDDIAYPYFRSDQSLRLNDWKWVPNHDPYGQQDIWFCMKAREKGWYIAQVPGMQSVHLGLMALGKRETNNGMHEIIVKTPIERQQYITIPKEHDYWLTTNKNSSIVSGIGNLTHQA
jgi:hypothetical protein